MTGMLYSLRMRAEQDGRHCCGAERVAEAAELPVLAAELVARALAGNARPDAVSCRIDRLPGDIPRRRLPDVRTFEVTEWAMGRACARTMLEAAGVSRVAAEKALRLLAAGPAPGGQVMRGAMIVDAATGERLEPDPARGVRVSRMDLDPAARSGILATLAAAGLGHHRVVEALVLAGKVLSAPAIVAELCWSDDPCYETGYVADPEHGYQRITRLKAIDDPCGGRALFVRSGAREVQSLIGFLEREAVLFTAPGRILPPQSWRG